MKELKKNEVGVCLVCYVYDTGCLDEKGRSN